MVRSIVRVLSGVLLALVPWAAATAQAGSIRGTVSDSAGNPLGSASISVEGSGLTASTAASGAGSVRWDLRSQHRRTLRQRQAGAPVRLDKRT